MSLNQQTIEPYLQWLWDIGRQRIFDRLIDYIRRTVFGAYQGREEPARRTS